MTVPLSAAPSAGPSHGANDAPRAASERILAAVAFAAQRLLHSHDHEAAIADAMAHLGYAADVSRIYVFEVAETETDLIARQRWEWVAAGIRPQIDDPDLQAFRLRVHGLHDMADALLAGRCYAAHTADLPAETAAMFAGWGIRSFAVVPIRVEDSLWGFIGIDECDAPRTWTDGELATLATAADVLAGAIQQDAARQGLRASERAYAAAYAREHEAATRLRTLDGMKDAFLEAVSHELRTPLTAVLGFAETLRRVDAAADPEHVQELIDRLVSNAERLRRLLDDLLDLEHLTRGTLHPIPELVDLRAVVHAVLEDVGDGLRGRPVAVDLAVTTASVDPAKLERILGNLLRNAVRHTPPGTPVTVRSWRAVGALQLAVEDEGPGIPDAHKRRVFEPFQQGADVPRHAPGTGVGLSVVARYAVVHGGRAWIEDRPGGGTVVRVTLAEDLVAPVA